MRGALCVSSGNRLRISSKKKMLDLREMGRKQHRRKTFVKSRQCKIQSFHKFLLLEEIIFQIIVSHSSNPSVLK